MIKLDHAIEKKKIEFLVEPEEIFAVRSKDEGKEEEVEEQKAHKKLRLFTKHKKTISIENLKGNIDAKIYRNRFVI